MLPTLPLHHFRTAQAVVDVPYRTTRLHCACAYVYFMLVRIRPRSDPDLLTNLVLPTTFRLAIRQASVLLTVCVCVWYYSHLSML